LFLIKVQKSFFVLKGREKSRPFLLKNKINSSPAIACNQWDKKKLID